MESTLHTMLHVGKAGKLKKSEATHWTSLALSNEKVFLCYWQQMQKFQKRR